MKKLKTIIILFIVILSAAGLCACETYTVKYEEQRDYFTLRYMGDYEIWHSWYVSCDAQDLTMAPTYDANLNSMWTLRGDRYITDNNYYDFLGVEDINGVMCFDKDGYRIPGTVIMPGTELTAKYSPKTMTFILDARGGNVVNDTVSVVYGSEITSFEVPTPPSPDMMFLGWNMLRYSGSWQEKQVADSYGRTLSDCQVLKHKHNGYGYELEGLGYEFRYRCLVDPDSDDWENRNKNYNIGEFNDTFTLFAKWLKKSDVAKVTLDYDMPDEWDTEAEQETREVERGSALEELPTLTYEDNIVYGWSYEKGNDRKIYNGEPINEDTTLYALWSKYKIIELYSQDEKCRDIKIIADGVLYTNNDEFKIERDGYELVGWYTNPEFDGSPVTMIQYANAPAELYVRWRKVEYTIIYNTLKTLVDGINIERVFYDVESDTFRLYDLTDVCPPNYTFMGWCTDAELSSEPLTEVVKGSFGNLNLYPKFKGDDVAVTLYTQYTEDMKYNDGVTTTTETIEYGSTYTIAPPVNLGYSFLGWYDAPEGGSCIADSTGRSLYPCSTAQSFTLYARWAYRGEVVTISYVDEDEVIFTQNVCVGDTLEFPNEPQKDGYIFVGWYNEDMTARYYESDKIYADVTLYAKWTEIIVSDEEVIDNE